MREKLQTILPLVRKPARYIGNELNSIHKDWEKTPLKILLAYPDLYEVGMSNLGLQILYHIINSREDTLAERTFTPNPDMAEQLRANALPLFSLESWKPAGDFDLIGFSLGHELVYTNLLEMLSLAGLPLRSADRNDKHPLIFAGGPGAFNPAPLAEFVDFFVIGEGEEVISEIAECGKDLEKISKLPGIFVPKLNNQTVKRYVKDFNNTPYPTRPIVPFVEAIHDRAVVEVMRGCMHICKFCSACRHYNPVREKKPEKVVELALEILKNTGYEELSLISLSSSDYSAIQPVARELISKLAGKRVNLSLPSMRMDSFGLELAREIQKVRPSTVTLAPEAGTQRLRDVIGKNLSEEDILKAAEAAFTDGVPNLKLYFMIGLPTETIEDLAGLSDLCKKIAQIGRHRSVRSHITASVSTFIPKPHTPFERERQITLNEIMEKQAFLKQTVKAKGLELRWHDARTSFIEGVFSRGDQKLSKVIEKAWKLGAKMDAWTEHFKFELWEQAFKECEVDPDQYLKARTENEELPWGKISLR